MSSRPPYDLMLAAQPGAESDMDHLVPVIVSVIGGQRAQSVNARQLHSFLESGQEFRHWIKDRIAQYDFMEHSDFETSEKIIRGGRATEYQISVSMAKELAMVERTAKGKEARQYFIECERRLQAAMPALPNFADPAAAARAWADEVEARRATEAANLQLEHKVAEQAPAVAGFDRIANAAGTNTLSVAAKFLQMQPGQLIEFLLARKWIFKRTSRSGNSWYIAYQDRLDAKYLSHKYGGYQDPDTSEWKTKEQVLVTRKGVAKLAEMLAVEEAERRMAAGAVQHQQRLPLPGNS